MSTNFYWVDKFCFRCSRSEKIHMAKRIWTDLFIWQAHPLSTRMERDCPMDFPEILSIKDWGRVVATRNGFIEDEYGSITHSDELFLPRVDSDQRKLDYVASQVEKYRDMYLDSAGNLFSKSWFS